MTKVDNLLKKMKNNQKGWRLDQLQSIARRFNIEWWHKGTSHCIFRTPNGQKLSVPAKRPIKPVYIGLFLDLIDTIDDTNIDES